jgi:hypothetical protein
MGRLAHGGKRPFILGSATRLQIRLAERFQRWPLGNGPERMTAAQALLLVEALRDDPPDNRKKTRTGMAPRLTKKELARLTGGKV